MKHKANVNDLIRGFSGKARKAAGIVNSSKKPIPYSHDKTGKAVGEEANPKTK